MSISSGSSPLLPLNGGRGLSSTARDEVQQPATSIDRGPPASNTGECMVPSGGRAGLSCLDGGALPTLLGQRASPRSRAPPPQPTPPSHRRRVSNPRPKAVTCFPLGSVATTRGRTAFLNGSVVRHSLALPLGGFTSDGASATPLAAPPPGVAPPAPASRPRGSPLKPFDAWDHESAVP
jgi:hypothetical protein